MNLKIATYNSQGNGPGRFEYIAQLLKHTDFLFIQEHWLYEDQSYLFHKSLNNIGIVFKSGMDSNRIKHGRPYGGVAMLWNKNLQCSVEPIVTKSKRLNISVVNMNTAIILMCNVYMPIYKDSLESYLTQYSEILHEIESVSLTYNCNHIVIGGDFNLSLEKSTNQHKCHKNLMKFINKMSLMCPEKYGKVNVKFSHENKANNSRSIIDHILVSDSLSQYVVKYHSMHDVNNLSDHNAIQIEMCVPCDRIYNDCSLEPGDTKIIWDRANTNHISNYKSVLDEYLECIKIPYSALYCEDWHCKEHSSVLQKFHDDIVDSCVKSAEKNYSKDFSQNKSSQHPWLE